jgi:hypothetical protein
LAVAPETENIFVTQNMVGNFATGKGSLDFSLFFEKIAAKQLTSAGVQTGTANSSTSLGLSSNFIPAFTSHSPAVLTGI